MLTRKHFAQITSKRILVTDGAMGTMLIARGLKPDQPPEELNLAKPEAVKEVHLKYLERGSNIVFTNTFGGTPLKLRDYGLDARVVEINSRAVKLAKEAAVKFKAFVAGDIGPAGSFLTPIGTLEFDEAYTNFAVQAKAFADAGADLIVLETFSDIRELKAALLAARDNFSGPVIASMTFTKDGRTVTGTDIKSFAAIAQALGADCVGLNCSVGPKHLLKLVKELSKNTNLPISVKPNRGIPKLINNETIYPGSLNEFVKYTKEFLRLGVNLVGGCCGTNPEFIGALSKIAKSAKPHIRKNILPLRFSSRTKVVDINNKNFYIIGERINPTGRKLLQEELRHGNFSTVSADAKNQTLAGAHFLDINMGLAGGDEVKLMKKACEIAQSISDCPLCIDSNSIDVLEAGLKEACGVPIINSTSGELEKLKKILPLAKRFGAGIICLTIDENGIPKNAPARIRIASRIIRAAKSMGIPKEKLFIDNLTLSLSAQQGQAVETLKAIKICSKKLKVKTVLGVSNISFGLPNRELINSTFLKLSKEAGLNFGIVNPYHNWKLIDLTAKRAIMGGDVNCINYIRLNAQNQTGGVKMKAAAVEISDEETLYHSILEGNKDNAVMLVDKLINKGLMPLDINSNILIKALADAGDKYEKKQMFLPQILLCAEAVNSAFTALKKHISSGDIKIAGKVVLATVKGDIHDIGKNILSAVLESHGFKVYDLGKNVEAHTILSEAKAQSADIIGLSALMTTTMSEMRNIIEAKLKNNLNIPIIVGGAAVTRNYASQIGADGYAKDALEAVTLVKSIVNK